MIDNIIIEEELLENRVKEEKLVELNKNTIVNSCTETVEPYIKYLNIIKDSVIDNIKVLKKISKEKLMKILYEDEEIKNQSFHIELMLELKNKFHNKIKI